MEGLQLVRTAGALDALPGQGWKGSLLSGPVRFTAVPELTYLRKPPEFVETPSPEPAR